MIESTLYLEVRYYETDQMAIVHHSNYIRYFECGRAKLMQDVGFPVERMVTRLPQLPTAKMLFETEIYNQDDVLLCTGTVKLGFIDADTRRPRRCPEDLLEVIGKYYD